MRRLLCVVTGIFVIAFAWGTVAHAAPNYPAPTGFVVDAANIIDDSVEASIVERLTAFEATSTIEIAVATIPSLEDLSIEEYATGLFQYWGVGKEKQDDGVLLLVAPTERKVRIEVGYGLEGALTDLESSQIIQDILVPAFKAGNYSQGIDSAVDAIVESVQGEYSAGTFSSSGGDFLGSAMGFLILLVVGFFVWVIVSQVILQLSRSKSIIAGGIIGGGLGSLMGLIMGTTLIGAIGGILFGLFVDWAVSRLPRFKKLREKAEKVAKELKKRPPGSGGFSGFGGGSSRGSSGGFSGFGGGMSGGGGSSGSW